MPAPAPPVRNNSSRAAARELAYSAFPQNLPRSPPRAGSQRIDFSCAGSYNLETRRASRKLNAFSYTEADNA